MKKNAFKKFTVLIVWLLVVGVFWLPQDFMYIHKGVNESVFSPSFKVLAGISTTIMLSTSYFGLTVIFDHLYDYIKK